MKRALRLTSSERNTLNVDQKAAHIYLQRIAEQLVRDLQGIDQDLPEATKARKVEKLRAKAKQDSARYLAEMADRRKLAESQAVHFGRENVLRRASLNASPGMQSRLASASIHELLAFAQDAEAEDNLTLAGAVQAEFSRRNVDDLGISRTIGEALGNVIIPERAQAEPMLKEVRDLALAGELLVRDITGETDPVFTLTAGRIMDSPIFEAE